MKMVRVEQKGECEGRIVNSRVDDDNSRSRDCNMGDWRRESVMIHRHDGPVRIVEWGTDWRLTLLGEAIARWGVAAEDEASVRHGAQATRKRPARGEKEDASEA